MGKLAKRWLASAPVPLLDSGRAFRERMRLRRALREQVPERDRLQAKLDDLLTVLGNQAEEQRSPGLEDAIQAVEDARTSGDASLRASEKASTELKRLVQSSVSELESIQEKIRNLSDRRRKFTSQLQGLQHRIQELATKPDAASAKERVELDALVEGLRSDSSSVDEELAATRRLEASATERLRSREEELRQAKEAASHGNVDAAARERHALIRLGRRALETAPDVDQDLVVRIRETQASLAASRASVQEMETKLASVPSNVSLGADVAALLMTLIGLIELPLLVGYNGVGRWLWAPLVGIAVAWGIPGPRWWWGLFRMAGAFAAYRCVWEAVSSPMYPDVPPTDEVVSLSILLAAIVTVVLVTWRWANPVSKASMFTAALLITASGSSLVLLHADLAQSERAEEAMDRSKRNQAIQENPDLWIDNIREAVLKENLYEAKQYMRYVEEAIGPQFPEAEELKGEIARLERTAEAEEAIAEQCGKKPDPEVTAREVQKDLIRGRRWMSGQSLETVECTDPRINGDSCWIWKCKFGYRSSESYEEETRTFQHDVTGTRDW